MHNDLGALHNMFWRLMEALEAAEQQHLRNGGLRHLTPADIRAVRRLGLSRRERMSSLAQQLRLTVGTLTTTIDRLVAKGYVLRNRIEDDRRVVEVSLSPDGREAFERIENARRMVAEQFFGKLSAEEREALGKLLKKLNE